MLQERCPSVARILKQGVSVNECICSEHCIFIYQRWEDNVDELYFKINGVLVAEEKLYQFHAYTNYEKPSSDPQGAMRSFELVVRKWMKHVVLSGDPKYKVKGDPDEVKATIDDLTRIVGQFKETAMPTVPADFGDSLKESYALIAGMFYLKHNKQIDSSRLVTLRMMIGQDLSKESLMELLEENNAKARSIKEIICGSINDSVMDWLVMEDKFVGSEIEKGITIVHFEGIKELLKVLCVENDIDFDLDEFNMECIDSLTEQIKEKWMGNASYRLNESTFVVHEKESRPKQGITETKKAAKKKTKSVERAPADNVDGEKRQKKNEKGKKKKDTLDIAKEKRSLRGKISYRRREIEALSSELEQLKTIGDKKEDKAQYIENELAKRYADFHQKNQVKITQESEVRQFVNETNENFSRLKREFTRKKDNEILEIKCQVFSSFFDPLLQLYVDQLKQYTQKYIQDLSQLFERVESKTRDFYNRGITTSSLQMIVKVMDKIYREGEEIKISFNDSVDEITMVYECMSYSYKAKADYWREAKESTPEDIEEKDRQKEAAANKTIQNKLKKAKAAFTEAEREVTEAGYGLKNDRVELERLEDELEALHSHFDSDKEKIEKDTNNTITKYSEADC